MLNSLKLCKLFYLGHDIIQSFVLQIIYIYIYIYIYGHLILTGSYIVAKWKPHTKGNCEWKLSQSEILVWEIWRIRKKHNECCKWLADWRSSLLHYVGYKGCLQLILCPSFHRHCVHIGEPQTLLYFNITSDSMVVNLPHCGHHHCTCLRVVKTMTEPKALNL